MSIKMNKKSTSFTARELERMKNGLPPWESMSFACGGWLQFYMFGVAKALQTKNLDKGVTYCGCSAGALTAVGLVVGGEFDDAIRFCKEYCVPNAYKNVSGLFKLSDYVAKCIELTILPNYKPIPNNVLQIAVTKLPFLTPERVVEHHTKEELILSLLASSAAVPLTPIVRMNNGWYIDGGLSDFQPIVDEDTITVSPFYFSNCDIKPSRYVPLWWTVMPPESDDTIDWIYNLGYEDCLQYIANRDIERIMGRKDILVTDSQKVQPPHPYDNPSKVSMHRFLGYNIHNITHNYVSFLMDFVLLLVLIFFWKPIALLLIYIELTVRVAFLAGLALLQTMFDLSPTRSIRRAVLKPYYVSMSYIMGFAHLQTAAEDAWIKRKLQTKQDLMECFTCIFSLSLILRFISGGPGGKELRKHDKLQKMSLLYRVFRHII